MVDEKSFLVKVGSGDYLVPAIFLGLRSKALSSHVVDDEVSKKRTKASGKPDGPIRNTKQEYIPQSSPSEVLYHIVLHTHPFTCDPDTSQVIGYQPERCNTRLGW